ncbi:MAG: glucose-1-phosphate thymidylyltransferase, partial [Cetobacterium sp.]
LNEMYLKEDTLNVLSLGRGMAWLDTGTHDGLLEASNFVKTIQSRQGIMVACLEEIAYNNGWIDRAKVIELAKPLLKSEYGKYLMSLVKE